MQTDTDLAVTYPDMRAARAAVRSLERAGVEGSEISLLGDADAAAQRQSNIDRDERLISYVSRAARFGAAAGILIGAAVGLGVGWVVFGLPSAGAWSTAGGGAFLGAGLGVLLGGILRLPQSNAGLATVDTAHQGPVTLGIHASPAPSAVADTAPIDVTTVPDVRDVLAAQRQRRAETPDTAAPAVSRPHDARAASSPGTATAPAAPAWQSRRVQIAAAAVAAGGLAAALLRVRRR